MKMEFRGTRIVRIKLALISCMFLVLLIPNDSFAIDCTLAKYYKFCVQPQAGGGGGGGGGGSGVAGFGGVLGNTGTTSASTTATTFGHEEQVRLYLTQWVGNPADESTVFVSLHSDTDKLVRDAYFQNSISLLIDDHMITVHHHNHLKSPPYVPQWGQQLTLFWLNNDITNHEFVSSLQYMVDHNIVKV